MTDGSVIADELAVANAHTLGATPWTRPDYLRKFCTLTEGLIDPAEAERFLDVAQQLLSLRSDELPGLTIPVPKGGLVQGLSGLF